MILPDDVAYEIGRAQRQAEAVAIYLRQQDHCVARRMLEHKIEAIHTYIQYLEARQNDQEESSED
jgi:hypothetical protein